MILFNPRAVPVKMAIMKFMNNNVLVILFNYLECHHTCATCVDLGDKCLSCNLNQTNRIDNSKINHSCSCQDRYFDDGTNQACFICAY